MSFIQWGGVVRVWSKESGLGPDGVGLRGFKSHTPHQSPSPVPTLSISLMGAEHTNKPETHENIQDKRFEQAIRRLKSTPNISDSDRTSIMELVEHLLAKGVGKPRAIKYINHLIVVSRIAVEIAGKSLGQFDRKGMEAVICRINTAKYTEHTKHDYKIIVKKYFQWLSGCDENEHEYPEQVKWIKTTLKKKRLLPEALLTKDELRKLIDATENLRDRALILTDYDGGFRIGEVLSLKIVNLAFDKYGAFVRVDGKTGPRRVRLTVSTSALSLWLSVHPFRTDPNAPLWVGVGTVGRDKPLSYDGARALLRRLAKKTGLKKRLYSHLMRHTRATELARIMTEAQLKEYFGWVSESDMPGNYVHLSGRDVDGVLLADHGIKVDKDDKAEMALTVTECPRCRNRVGTETQFCPTCGMVLTDKAAIKLEEERNMADKLMDMLMKDEEVRRLLARKVSELYGPSRPHPSSPATP